MKHVRKVIEIDEALCNGCGQCLPSCAEGAIQVIDGKARLVSDRYCDGLGACLGECPTGALRIVEREADAFDESAVQHHMAARKAAPKASPASPPPAAHPGCPGARMRMFSPRSNGAPLEGAQSEGVQSALTHWPVQIRLVPAHAPFLHGADLLVMADCVPVAYADTHRDLIKGRVVLVGCPKFDNAQEYVGRFVDILCTAQLRSITVAVMEVPCCQGLPAILRQAIDISGVEVPVEVVVVSLQGEVLKRFPMGETQPAHAR